MHGHMEGSMYDYRSLKVTLSDTNRTEIFATKDTIGPVTTVEPRGWFTFNAESGNTDTVYIEVMDWEGNFTELYDLDPGDSYSLKGYTSAGNLRLRAATATQVVRVGLAG